MKKILSTTLLRTLAIVCGLFGYVLTSYAYYDEEIEANKEFYIYNVANGKYLKNNNGAPVLVKNVEDASPWIFSKTSGSVSLRNEGNYLKIDRAHGIELTTKILWWNISYETDPGATTNGEVTIDQNESKFTLGEDEGGYYMYLIGEYGHGLLSNARTGYFFLSNNLKAVQTTSLTVPNDAARWRLVSKRQVDNTISLSTESISLDAIEGGAPAESQFYINNSGKILSIILANGSNKLEISSPANPAPIKVAFQVAKNGLKTITISGANDANAIYSFDPSTDASVTLTVSTTAASGNAKDADQKQITIKGNVVELTEQYIDWIQNFTTLSPTDEPISLTAVAKTTGGKPTDRTIEYTLASEGVVRLENNILYVIREGTTSIKASVAKDETYVGAEKTLDIKVSGLPASATDITQSNATTTGIYTGTVGGPYSSYAFHRGKTAVNLEKCFNSSGEALFDTLYVFGVTSNTDGEVVTYMGADGVQYNNVPKINTPDASIGCNATTPCYVFAKTNDTTYTHTRTFDATQTRYDWEDKQVGKHLYFTGYCPFAYMGITPTDEGWMYFKGGNTTLDVYLDNCEIMGRFKTQKGRNNPIDYENYTLWLQVTDFSGTNPNVSFMSGSSSPFVFTSLTKQTGESYKLSIHIAGRNHLQGQQGSYIKETWGKGYTNIMGVEAEVQMNAGIGSVFTYSAPITLKPADLGNKTDFVLTDIWADKSITNGYLHLDATKPTNSNAEKVVAIDLGSPNGSLTINGGQYHLRNAAADGTYACNLAVGYRVFSKTVEKEGMTALLHLYGFGGDMADSKVIINSGTFTMYKNMYYNGLDAKRDSTYLGEGYYKDQDNFLDLRLPAGNGTSQINGGTFNGISNVLMCTKVTTTGASPINGADYWLCLQDVPVTGTNPDGSATFDIPAPFVDAYDNGVVYNLVSGKDNVVNASAYGAQSANAVNKDGTSIVRLLLPGDACGEGECVDCKYQKEAIIFQWATAIPKFEASKNMGTSENPQWESVNVGGAVDVKIAGEGEDIVYQTNQLLYVDCAGMENYSMDLVEQGAKLSFDDPNMPRGQFTNENNYQIEDHLNILKSVQADTWYTFTAPFNVHDISVIETNEKTIDVKDRKRSDALQLQAEDNLNIFYDLQDFIIPTAEGRASSLILTDLLKANSSMPNRVRQPLTHYNGENIMIANYYLYELENEVFSTTGTGENLDITWTPVKRDSGDTIMYQGKTYAIQFPWCPMCNDLDKRDYYDYWSNKLILFHGNGPQEVWGTDKQSSLASAPAAGSATLAGNSTFADMTLAAEAGYVHVHNMTDDYFELNRSAYTVKPTEGFLLYKSGSSKMPARISRSGQMEYDENVEAGLPTIGERSTIMLFGAMDGFEVLSLGEQLVTVYNLQGNIVFQKYMAAGEQIYVHTGSGIFIVRGENESIKIMVD